ERLDVENGLPYPDAFFDYAACLGSLEHFRDQTLVLSEISRVCRQSSKICLYVPNDQYLLHRLGYETDYQPVVKRHSAAGWRCIIEGSGIRVTATAKANLHLLNLRESSSRRKLIAKIATYPFVLLLPLSLSHSLWFVCEPIKA
ncbi:MAG TPA: methyltransferase domain-containing protein, partial [Chloroflexi bacterium]|nr:methyltransferase domain-containing protein [Chloroflexota bacterium]